MAANINPDVHHPLFLVGPHAIPEVSNEGLQLEIAEAGTLADQIFQASMLWTKFQSRSLFSSKWRTSTSKTDLGIQEGTWKTLFVTAQFEFCQDAWMRG